MPVARVTDPASTEWGTPTPAGFRRSEVAATVGFGDDAWHRAVGGVLHWRVKTSSGFEVDSDHPVRVGEHKNIRFRLLGLTVVEPVEVTAVVTEPSRVGFAYRTLPGHPVSGEEAFIVDRVGEEVRLSVRSLTAPSERRTWRAIYPLLLLAQGVIRRRYLRALRRPADGV